MGDRALMTLLKKLRGSTLLAVLQIFRPSGTSIEFSRDSSEPLEAATRSAAIPGLTFPGILPVIYVNFPSSEPMDDQSINAVVAEIKPLLIGRAPGKIFQLSPSSMAIDFGLREPRFLLLSVEPSLPRMYLVKRRVRDLEKQSTPLGQFALFLRKELSGTTLRTVQKDTLDRVVRFHFVGTDELGREQRRTLVAQLTGRSANLFLLDEKGVISHRARSSRGSVS